jgi:hypothetical protein
MAPIKIIFYCLWIMNVQLNIITIRNTYVTDYPSSHTVFLGFT